MKLEYLNDWSESRRWVASYYSERLTGLPIRLPKIESYNTHIFHQYVIATSQREELAQYLKHHGIETAIYYPVSLHLQKCFEYLGYKEGDLPESEKASRETLALPIFPEITLKEQGLRDWSHKNFFTGR